MASLFTLTERWQSEVPDFISLSAKSPAIFRVLRLLSGTVVIEASWENKITLVQENYLNGTHVESQKDFRSFLDIVFEDGVPEDVELIDISHRLNKRDRAFYSGLMADVTLLLSAIENERNTESFLLIYRLLERLSVALPLIYTSREKSFREANKFLQAMMGENGAGSDLGILDRFLSQYGANNSTFQNLTIEFDVFAPQEEMVKSIISQVNSCLSGQVQDMDVIKERSRIVVPYSSMSQFIANLRHRCFHDQAGRHNFELSKIGGSEVLFACFVKKLLIWFSYILVDIVRWEIERVNK